SGGLQPAGRPEGRPYTVEIAVGFIQQHARPHAGLFRPAFENCSAAHTASSRAVRNASFCSRVPIETRRNFEKSRMRIPFDHKTSNSGFSVRNAMKFARDGKAVMRGICCIAAKT